MFRMPDIGEMCMKDDTEVAFVHETVLLLPVTEPPFPLERGFLVIVTQS
jgi:hypothetical protein